MELQKEYQELEQMRIKLRNLHITLNIISIIIILFIIFIFKLPVFIIFGLVVCLLIKTLIISGPEKKYSLKYKDFFVKQSLSSIFTNLNYEPEKGIGRELISSTNMMYMGDRYSSNDLISGQYKDTAFVQADVHIEEEHHYTDSDGHTHTEYVTIFRGRWMLFEFNKIFKANLQVSQKGFGNNKIGNFFSKNKLQKVELESQEFNKRFSVYAVEPIDAFYVLTPKMMERIINLDEKNSGKILLCFVNNCLHVGLYDNKDSFEHGSVFKKINPEKERTNISSDIEKITMFIDELELDNDLFKR